MYKTTAIDNGFQLKERGKPMTRVIIRQTRPAHQKIKPSMDEISNAKNSAGKIKKEGQQALFNMFSIITIISTAT